MKIAFDPVKRAIASQDRGVDFLDAALLFDDPSITLSDMRFDYPEERYQTFGFIKNRLFIVVWTPIEDGIRVISMRKCNEREQKAFAARVG
jgi:uncharacterized DUF497 family protein